MPEHNPEDLPCCPHINLGSVEDEKFVNVRGFPIHTRERGVVLSSFKEVPHDISGSSLLPPQTQ